MRSMTTKGWHYKIAEPHRTNWSLTGGSMILLTRQKDCQEEPILCSVVVLEWEDSVLHTSRCPLVGQNGREKELIPCRTQNGCQQESICRRIQCMLAFFGVGSSFLPLSIWRTSDMVGRFVRSCWTHRSPNWMCLLISINWGSLNTAGSNSSSIRPASQAVQPWHACEIKTFTTFWYLRGCLVMHYHILPSFQIMRRLGFSTYITFPIHLYKHYIWIHN
jgi:hypothetical protein